MCDAAQVLHDASEGYNAEFELGFLPRDGALDRAVKGRLVLWQDQLRECLGIDLAGSRLELTDAIEPIGPDVLVPHQIRGEAARLAQQLRLGKVIEGPPKIRLARLQGLFCEILLRHVLNGPHEYGSAVDAFAETPDGMQMLRNASGGHDSELKVDIIA